ncbi:MAG: glycosyltransferase [Candidatus Omnitrophica bacterium]|nr:glycosyltransferase [Candidatus Omnitrophota bacterium]
MRYLRFLIPENSSVLEIGCYAGEKLAALNPKKGVGVCFSKKMIDVAKEKHPHLDFHFCDIDHKLNIEEKFDYIIVSNTVGYAYDLQSTFHELKKVCHPGTKIILFYHSHFWKYLLKLAEVLRMRMVWPNQHWLTKEDLVNLFYLNDFSLIRSSEQMIIPFYIPLISAIFNRFIAHLPVIRGFALNNIMIFQPLGQRKDPKEVTCSVIIPCRNEKGNIEPAIQRTPMLGAHTEFIFVEGHSQDGTLEECQRVKEKYPQHDIKVFSQTGKGKGNAVREGFAAATGDVLMILDADLTTPPEDMPKFFEAIATGKGEFINGTRLVYQMEKNAMRFLNMLANKFFSVALTYLLGQYLKDTLCGTKVLWREDYFKIEQGRSYFGDFDPFGDFDLLFGAAKLNLKIIEIPVQYKARTYGETQISRFKHGWLLIKMTVFAMRKIKFI